MLSQRRHRHTLSQCVEIDFQHVLGSLLAKTHQRSSKMLFTYWSQLFSLAGACPPIQIHGLMSPPKLCHEPKDYFTVGIRYWEQTVHVYAVAEKKHFLSHCFSFYVFGKGFLCMSISFATVRFPAPCQRLTPELNICICHNYTWKNTVFKMEIKCKRYLKERPKVWEANNSKKQVFSTHRGIIQV